MSRLALKQLVCLQTLERQRSLVWSCLVKKVSDVRQHFLARHKELQRAFLTFTIVNEIHLYTHVVGAFFIVLLTNKTRRVVCVCLRARARRCSRGGSPSRLSMPVNQAN